MRPLGRYELAAELAAADAGRVLVVDDEPQVSRLLVRMLESAGYTATGVLSAEQARAELSIGDVAVLIADVNMPGESGIDLIRDISRSHPEVGAMMVSGIDDPGVAEVALEFGAYGYLTKPVRQADLVIAVVNAFRRRDLEQAQRALQERLTTDLQSTLERLDSASEQMARSREETLRQLAHAVELRDLETGDHVERMSRYCALLARLAGLDPESIRVASQLHDIGKIGVLDAILLKPGPITADERADMERHTVIGYELLRESSSETLRLASLIAVTHHERFDGTGYPHGLSGGDIPLEGRIAAVADVFDALTSDRVYRRAFPIPVAVAMMRAERGRHFDPELLDLFIARLDEVMAIHAQFAPAARQPARRQSLPATSITRNATAGSTDSSPAAGKSAHSAGVAQPHS